MTPKHRGTPWYWTFFAACLISTAAHSETTTAPFDHFQAPFHPGATFGGFGGGDCKVSRTPVIFIHGRQDTASDWMKSTDNQPSLYQQFITAGYNPCELFGITYIPDAGRKSLEYNPLQPDTFTLLHQFIERVRLFTHASQVDLVGYDIGAVAALATLEYSGSWDEVRRMVNIAGPLRGLPNCTTQQDASQGQNVCAAQSLDNAFHFGLYPSEDSLDGYNEWTSDSGLKSLRAMAQNHPMVSFYTLSAGTNDELLCPSRQSSCADSATFAPANNVMAQLEWQDKGVNHQTLKSAATASVIKMLTTHCKGTDCAASAYPVVAGRP
ncbi:lipase family protein [Vibrio porteresiae]|uniref:Lipase family protein n=1 Tax=Vibrio porteresiae DSM 19223 TaxID=1123496 RepID=A0ABZ0QF28_9VIBR|nr:lipase family protein [Vibrio porteresiae]WPC75084.1 lipase family protein [Vibrio porteresiae DSM 19223]